MQLEDSTSRKPDEERVDQVYNMNPPGPQLGDSNTDHEPSHHSVSIPSVCNSVFKLSPCWRPEAFTQQAWRDFPWLDVVNMVIIIRLCEWPQLHLSNDTQPTTEHPLVFLAALLGAQQAHWLQNSSKIESKKKKKGLRLLIHIVPTISLEALQADRLNLLAALLNRSFPAQLLEKSSVFISEVFKSPLNAILWIVFRCS